MDHSIGRVPYPPNPHVTLTVWTAQGIAPGAPLVALAIGQGRDDLNRPLDDALDLGQGLVNHALELGKRLGSLHAVIPDTLKTFGKDMLHHASNEGIHVDGFPFHPLALMRAIVIGHLLPIIAIDPS